MEKKKNFFGVFSFESIEHNPTALAIDYYQVEMLRALRVHHSPFIALGTKFERVHFDLHGGMIWFENPSRRERVFIHQSYLMDNLFWGYNDEPYQSGEGPKVI